MVIQSKNLLHENAPKTFLTDAVAAGATVLAVRNSAGFTTSWAKQIGETGQEQTEVIIGTVTNGGTLTGAAVSFAHPADTPVYDIKFDQVVFERSTAGTAGTAAPMTSGTVSYRPDGSVTQFDDTSGTPSYAYRTYYRNSSLLVNSIESDWITSAGFSFYSLGKLRDRVRNKLWSSSYVTDTVIDDWINEWKDEMTNAVIKVNENYAMGTVDVGFGTAGLGTITTADFKQVRKFWVTYDGNNFYKSTPSDPSDFLPDQVFTSVHPYHTFVGDSVFKVLPGDSGGTARLEFYRFGTTMVNDTDELPLPMRSYTKSFVDYCVAQALFKDGRGEQYDRMLANALSSREMFVNEVAPRDKTGPTMIKIVEPTVGDDWTII